MRDANHVIKNVNHLYLYFLLTCTQCCASRHTYFTIKSWLQHKKTAAFAHKLSYAAEKNKNKLGDIVPMGGFPLNSFKSITGHLHKRAPRLTIL